MRTSPGARGGARGEGRARKRLRRRWRPGNLDKTCPCSSQVLKGGLKSKAIRLVDGGDHETLQDGWHHRRIMLCSEGVTEGPLPPPLRKPPGPFVTLRETSAGFPQPTFKWDFHASCHVLPAR